MSHPMKFDQFLFYLQRLDTIPAAEKRIVFSFLSSSSAKKTETVVNPRLLGHHYPKTPHCQYHCLRLCQMWHFFDDFSRPLS